MKTYSLPILLTRKVMRETDQLLYNQHCQGIFDDGDPNHPKYNDNINYITGLPDRLFGYDVEQFMKWQYK